ncbi:MAG: carbonic anhydrase [Crocinitomicaceae bacterium]|nr:carbonic anhydrase [Crocinitomicaceae bacterium]
MRTQTKYTQENITPEYALQILKEGNWRFEQNVRSLRDLRSQVKETKEAQYPFAAILSCIDSRVPAELVFDQGIGDIFSLRVAGNIVNEDMLGSLEYACKVAGSKIIVVLGHTKCGAVTAACNKVELGNITPLLKKITAADDIIGQHKERISDQSIEVVAMENVKNSVERIKAESPILLEMLENNEINIVGAIYDVAKGRVDFL